MGSQSPRTGIALAFVCLAILGVMPIIAGGRPVAFDALGFAFFLSVWQVVFSVPLVLREATSANKGLFGARLDPGLRRRTFAIVVVTGGVFGLATFLYVLAIEKAGPVNAAIAMQAYPLFAILIESVFLGRRKNVAELACTFVLLAALYALATGGTWRIDGISGWFLVALIVPFLWTIAHVVIKEELARTPITPAQVTFLRVSVSMVLLGAVLVAVAGPEAIAAQAATPSFQVFALAMGLAYYLELIFWFYAVRSIDVSVASSIVVPAPALTMALAIAFLGESVAAYQVAALGVVVASLYGLLFAGARKRRAATTL